MSLTKLIKPYIKDPYLIGANLLCKIFSTDLYKEFHYQRTCAIREIFCEFHEECLNRIHLFRE